MTRTTSLFVAGLIAGLASPAVAQQPAVAPGAYRTLPAVSLYGGPAGFEWGFCFFWSRTVS